MNPKILKPFKYLLTAAVVLAAGMFAVPEDAAAGDYCREYTRTVNIGGRLQDAYGTACLQPDGSWMIVGEGLGNDIPSNVNNVDYVIHDGPQTIVPPRVVYYERPPVYYYQAPRPRPYSVWYNDGRFYRNGIYVNIGGKDRRDHGRRDWGRGHHDNGWHNGWRNGRGHH